MTTQPPRASLQMAGDAVALSPSGAPQSSARVDGGADPRPVLLVVEAEATLAASLAALGTSFQVHTVENRDAAIVQMRRHDPAVIAIDLDRQPAQGSLRYDTSASAAGQVTDASVDTFKAVAAGIAALLDAAGVPPGSSTAAIDAEAAADADATLEGTAGHVADDATARTASGAASGSATTIDADPTAESDTSAAARPEQTGKSLAANARDASAAQAEAFRTLRDLMALSPSTRAIAIIAAGDREAAIRAIALGAHDVFEKPIVPTAFSLIVDRAFRIADLEQESGRKLDALTPSGIDGVETRDPHMLRVCRQIEQLAQTRDTVLLLGEGGTGKHLLAQALHLMSPRKEQRFAVVRCTAADVGRIEAELFGVEKTERTESTGTAGEQVVHDLRRAYPGKLELANGGSLFLDEVSELSPGLQLRLLHFLEDRSIRRLGSAEDLQLDVRIICASRCDLAELASQGRFHRGLAYLLSEMALRVPPLRQRAGDAALLAHALLRRLGRRHGRNRLSFSESALDAIESHSFPGNVKELENMVRRAVVTASGRTISATDLGLPTPQAPEMLNLRRIRDEAERQAVLRVMARADGNVARAAELLGISRPTLYDLLNRFGLR